MSMRFPLALSLSQNFYERFLLVAFRLFDNEFKELIERPSYLGTGLHAQHLHYITAIDRQIRNRERGRLLPQGLHFGSQALDVFFENPPPPVSEIIRFSELDEVIDII
jgi:hypothetical protein